MFSQNEIDAVLRDAQTAVDDLSEAVVGAPAVGTAPRARGESAGVGGATSAEGAGRSASMTANGASTSASRLRRILHLRVPVRVQLARRLLPVAELMKIAPGTILEFDQNVGIELALLVNNRRIGQGVAVKVNERFGLRITSIGDIRSRIESLSH